MAPIRAIGIGATLQDEVGLGLRLTSSLRGMTAAFGERHVAAGLRGLACLSCPPFFVFQESMVSIET